MTTLVVEHEAEAPPGLLGRTSLDLHVVRPYAGDALPDDLTWYDGLIVLGGAMGANDDEQYAWLTPTKALIEQAVRTNIPSLFICLGHQLAAVATGGVVERNPQGPLWGVEPVGLTVEGQDDLLLKHLPEDAHVVHWNGDIVTHAPAGTTVLARDRRGDIQAVRYGSHVWGLQCHPEADAAIAARWAEGTEDPERAASALEAVRRYQRDLESAWRPVIEAYSAVVEETRFGPG